MSLTYQSAGVDIDAGTELVRRIKQLKTPQKTTGWQVLSGIGGFSGLFEIDWTRYKNPILVSSCDGVGTKIKVAQRLNQHRTLGIDLVAMCVNDLVTCGGEPLFFLDYLSFGKLDVDLAEDLLKGIVEGCNQAGCALLGGETAEMPSVYPQGEYDLAGFAVGVVEKEKVIDGSRINAGDAIIGIASSGPHSNGFSLIRKVFESDMENFKDELLNPTRIYVRSVLTLKQMIDIKGLAHITGGGFLDNIPRILPDKTKAVIKKGYWDIPHIFTEIQKRGEVTESEMFRTFNMGIGLVLIVAEKETQISIERLNALGEQTYLIGQVEMGNKEVEIK
ncbi:MAG: phosphoribosylformylglycinamidine cyclo-ligase [bacterium]|nr:phosphoribosylformylglycinamidine cyclo-ligase [bacterium]